MSELINASDAKRTIRWKLLSTASIVALLAAVYGSNESQAANQDADRPTVWIELGGQMEHIEGQGYSFAPGFLAANPNSPVLQTITPLQAQRPAPFNFDEEGKISIQPEGADWIVSVGVIYGRSGSTKHIDHQVSALHHNKYVSNAPAGNITSHVSFADTHTHRQQSHTILDFSVGRDVGVGMFGREGTSILGIGVRIAQFASRETFDARAAPDLRVKYLPSATAPTRIRLPYFHTYHFTGQSSRSFHGIGPSLSWSGSAPIVGAMHNGELMFDWGANAALIFGRQVARVGHFESAHYHSALALGDPQYALVYKRSGGHNGSRTEIVPNAGGFAGATYRIENFKLSFGYRADFFFGAIDGGVDTRKSETLGFYGPFASISVGLGG